MYNHPFKRPKKGARGVLDEDPRQDRFEEFAFFANRYDHRAPIRSRLLNDPQIILADEPTGSLDLNTAKGIFDLLKNQINSNRLIIFATHNRFFANKSDCLLEIVNGNIKTING